MVNNSRFLEPETRNDFLVDVERKKLWKALLDILEVVIAICDRHGIRYIVDGGSLLGAVRHGGIIPWDDDIDISMPRDDYERLQEILPRELPAHLFMQTTLTDPDYCITHIKIRDGRKTAIAPYHIKEGRRYNMGVFLDVFPIDGMAPTESLRVKHLRDLKRVKTVLSLAGRHRYKSPKQRITSWLARFIVFVVGRGRLYRLRERIQSRYRFSDSADGILGLGEWGYKSVWSRKLVWYVVSCQMQFEYLKVRCPQAATDCLLTTYGDWQRMIKGGGLHGGIDFDLDHDYQTVLKEKYGC